MNVKVFWCEEAGKVRRQFRRYRLSYNDEGGKCPGPHGYHNGHAELDVTPWEPRTYIGPFHAKDFAGDPRWPTKCDHCDYVFRDEDGWQIFAEGIMRHVDTGEEFPMRDAPVGAMWDAWWVSDRREKRSVATWVGQDGIALVVKTPGGEWMVDSRASNCTMPDDDEHYCWVRHGDPRTGEVHVDKNGRTCAAGAGSILSGSYHGFLHNGHLTSC